MPQLNNLLISTFSAAKVVCNYAFAAKNGIRNSCRLLPAALIKFRLLLAFMKKLLISTFAAAVMLLFGG